MTENVELTIFTPTYNRAYVLDKLYESLKRQTVKDFIWLLVDDGSIDDTGKLVEEWTREGIIEINYIYQENKGKSMAHNNGVDQCKTPWFTCVDSDDYLTDNAVERICRFLKKREECIGYVFMRKHSDGSAISRWPKSLHKTKLKDAYDTYKAIGDTMLIYRTKLLKKYKFPYFDGEKFVPEGYLYDILDGYGDLIFIHEPIYVCDYLDDGYTKSMAKTIKNNPQGYIAYIKQRLKKDTRLSQVAGDTIRYCAICICSKKKRFIRDSGNRFITVVMLPFGYLLYLRRYKGI